VEGFFEPAVELGQMVKVGDVLGSVTDALGERIEPIRSRYSGMVLVIHARCFIAAEESVGVVLELD
jgi:predicted deacylase